MYRDNTKVVNEFNYTAKTSLTDGLKQILKYQQSFMG